MKNLNALVLSLLLTASGLAWSDPAPVKQVSDKLVIEFQPGTPGRVSYLKTAKTTFETPNAKIGTLQDGWRCGNSSDIIWNEKAYKLFSRKLAASLHGVLEKAHYPTPISVDTIFDTPTEKERPKAMPELQIGALLKDVSANLCLKDHGGIGGVYMKVFWQVYSPEVKKVVFEALTEGSFQTAAAEDIPVDQIFLRAYEQAAKNFLAEQGFYNAVTRPSTPAEAAPKPATPERLTLNRIKPAAEPLTKRVTPLRSSVPTVVTATSTGSGFFISSDGYLLTNRHVVGADKMVKIKLPTGRELIGEVLRSDVARDVALIKTEPVGVPALSIREDEPNIGEEVYVIGSPLGDTFNTSLTRGILSGYRVLGKQRMLQSDVSILSGSSGGPLLDAGGRVIGISVSHLTDARTMAGMNFFIPIGDVLTTLGLDLK
ncbi:S1C family serine protease [Duganella violaceipulchra]|uniref:Serine protease n=1 Tax=Duganella violaceipulchra TaxID=2849652 RepID=A0AA41L6I2_9BURK|nr:serine protease [Duganella violaceicalia]MBV6325299.1 serine protease [Duganella violaceicalia]MCP2009823.1 S1-C subfamily serine protease [Duganella violaceicalia]